MSVQYVGWVVGAALIWRYRGRARTHLERTQPETYRDMTGRPPQADWIDAAQAVPSHWPTQRVHPRVSATAGPPGLTPPPRRSGRR